MPTNEIDLHWRFSHSTSEEGSQTGRIEGQVTDRGVSAASNDVLGAVVHLRSADASRFLTLLAWFDIRRVDPSTCGFKLRAGPYCLARNLGSLSSRPTADQTVAYDANYCTCKRFHRNLGLECKKTRRPSGTLRALLGPKFCEGPE